MRTENAAKVVARINSTTYVNVGPLVGLAINIQRWKSV